MPDILDAAQTNTQTPPAAPPEPVEPPPAPLVDISVPPLPESPATPPPPTDLPPVPPAPPISDNLVIPSEETPPPPSEAPKPAEPAPPSAPPPEKKKKRMRPVAVVTGILMLFILLPLTAFYVAQNRQLILTKFQAGSCTSCYCCSGIGDPGKRNECKADYCSLTTPKPSSATTPKPSSATTPKPGTQCAAGKHLCQCKAGSGCVADSVSCTAYCGNANNCLNCTNTGTPVPSTTSSSAKCDQTRSQYASLITSCNNPTYCDANGVWHCPAVNKCATPAPSNQVTSCIGKMMCSLAGGWTCVPNGVTPSPNSMYCSTSKCPNGCATLTTDGGVCSVPPNAGKPCTNGMSTNVNVLQACGNGLYCDNNTHTCKLIQAVTPVTTLSTSQYADCLRNSRGIPSLVARCNASAGSNVTTGNRVIGQEIPDATNKSDCTYKGGTFIDGTCYKDYDLSFYQQLAQVPTNAAGTPVPGVGPISCEGSGYGNFEQGTVSEPCPGGGYLIERIAHSGCPNGQTRCWCTVDRSNCAKPTKKPNPTTAPQCVNMIAYDADWNALSKQELARLSVGDKITLAYAPGGKATKVRFAVNPHSPPVAADWHPTTSRNPKNNAQFVWKYTLEDKSSFRVIAQWFDGTSWHN